MTFDCVKNKGKGLVINCDCKKTNKTIITPYKLLTFNKNKKEK